MRRLCVCLRASLCVFYRGLRLYSVEPGRGHVFNTRNHCDTLVDYSYLSCVSGGLPYMRHHPQQPPWLGAPPRHLPPGGPAPPILKTTAATPRPGARVPLLQASPPTPQLRARALAPDGHPRAGRNPRVHALLPSPHSGLRKQRGGGTTHEIPAAGSLTTPVPRGRRAPPPGDTAARPRCPPEAAASEVPTAASPGVSLRRGSTTGTGPPAPTRKNTLRPSPATPRRPP